MYERLPEQSLHSNSCRPSENVTCPLEIDDDDNDTENVSHHSDTIDLAKTSLTHKIHPLLNAYNQILSSFRSLKGSPRELYLCYVLNYCESYGYFALSQILVLYLHSEFGCSDMEAGMVYGMWGASITLWSFMLSCINDKLGVKKSLLIGFSISALASVLIACATSKYMIFIVLFGILPIGNCIGMPMLTVGVKRCTNVANRGFAFGLYYAVMNVAALVSGPVVDVFNIVIPSIFGNSKFSGNRMVILSVTFTYLCSLITTIFFVRDFGRGLEDEVFKQQQSVVAYEHMSPLQESSNESFTHTQVEETLQNDHGTKENISVGEIVWELLHSKTFWRFCCFTIILINLRTVFRHMDATLPTYLIRCFGPTFPKGIIYSINPFMIIFLTPIVSALTTQHAHYDMIKYGGYISAISPFFLAISTSTWAVIMFMVFLSIGESIWSPRLYDYTMSVAPNGKEATFSSLASAPLFAAKVPVGLLSGYLVSTYLPENVQGCPQGQMLWLVIAVLTCTSPILITVLERCIREPVDPTKFPRKIVE